jgi:hypothetical protein
MFVSVVLAQWAEEQGYRWPPMYNNPGNVGDPVSAGQQGYPTIADGVNAYVDTLKLDYYVKVLAQRSPDAQCYALGESPWAASQYDGEGPPPGEDLVKIINDFNLTQWDAAPPIYQEIIMGLPSGCQDAGAINSQIREWWNTYRTDPMTSADQEVLLYCFNVPVANGGFGGNPDALQAHIVDTAEATGKLRPAMAGSV